MPPSNTDRPDQAEPADQVTGAAQPDLPDHSPVIRHDRYRLDDFIEQHPELQSWRAYDLVLNRVVGIQIVTRAHPNFDNIHRAAHLAGGVVDRRIVRVIDVVPDTEDLFIVSEWMDGLPLDEFIHTPLDPQQAVTLTQKVAEAVCALNQTERLGPTQQERGHGRLTPQCIIVNPNGEVRLRGHLVQAALWGTVHGATLAQEDIAATGAVLEAGLTATWPAPVASQLEQTPLGDSNYALPGQLRAWLPKSIDTFVAKTRISPDQHPQTKDVRLGLLAIQQELPDDSDAALSHSSQSPSRRSQLLKRGLAVTAGVAAVGAIGVSGFALVQSGGAEPIASSASQPSRTGADAQAAAALNANAANPTAGTRDPERALPIVAAWGLDESHKKLTSTTAGAFVHDNDITTGWRTKSYRSANVGQANADGLLVDLGASQAINAINLDLIGGNTDLTIKVGSKKQLVAGKGRDFAEITSAPSDLVVRKARAIDSRFLLISFTKVPLGTDGYQGGILSLKVLGQ